MAARYHEFQATVFEHASETTSKNSEAFTLLNYRGYSFYINYTKIGGAALSATLRLQASNDKINWVNISGTDVTITGTGDYLYNVFDVYYRFTRIQLVMSSGTITTTANFHAKGH